ncbi:hypothetical protein Asp14428_00590 [Actinoplanes sp. NBRC 14428]|nr:hypothetical protein Asp14428_00590 [Actinoplanes sp. NBRC 14428]
MPGRDAAGQLGEKNLRRSKLHLTALAAVFTGAGLLAAPAAAAPAAPELKLAATDDTYVSSGRVDATFGDEDKLAVGRLGRDSKIAYLKFLVPAGAKVTGARLKLITVGDVGGPVTVSRVADAGWSERKLTARTAPQPGAPAGTASPAADAAEVSIDLRTAVTGPGAYSFAVRSSASSVTRFRSSEAKGGGPELIITTAQPAKPAPAKPAPTTPAPTKPAPTTPAPTKPAPTTPAPTKPVPATPAPTKPAPTQATPTPAPAKPSPSQPAPVPSTPPTQSAPAPTTSPSPSQPAPAPTTPPTQSSPAPTTPPATPIEDEDMPPPATGDCVTGDLLVPSCGVLWGAAAGGFTDAPRDQALKDWEKLSGRTASIFHAYHKGDEPFPTKSEMAMARDAAKPRVLLLNWKIAYGSTWAKVAKGEQDARIDRFAARIQSTFPEKFFLVLNHEPENDVIAKPGSGWEAKDFAAMYRHTILRLRAKGVTNAINVMAYMGNEKWMAQSWWKDLYPGDDVVDWMGLDSYVSAEKGYYHYGTFADLLDRKAPNGPTFYDWATSKHAGKPLMIAEWGVYHRVGRATDKTAGFNSVLPELRKRPNIKAIVYFDTKSDDEGDRDISIDSTKANLAAFRTLAADPIFNVKLR